MKGTEKIKRNLFIEDKNKISILSLMFMFHLFLYESYLLINVFSFVCLFIIYLFYLFCKHSPKCIGYKYW